MKLSFGLRLSLICSLVITTLSPGMQVALTAAEHHFDGQVGLQLYSLRNQFAKDVPGTLDIVKGFGVRYVELAGTYGLTPEQFKSQLDARGLQAVSGHFSYDSFRTNVESLARDAKIFGLKYVGAAWIPHDDKVPFDEKTCREAIAVFNNAGKALAKHGLKFMYHVHGYEFQPYKDGTLLDLMMSETDPKHVSFEMDVFWIVHPGQDPVKLLDKYGNRWELLHVKGMKEGTPTGLLTGHSDVSNDVALGVGKIDYVPILRAAARAGVKWYIIEDESPASVEQIPQSLQYLKTVTY